jgi:FixJ family two-component response regulator
MRAREKEFVIAVVDNEAALREALSKLLRPAGYGVRTFASAEDFLASEGWHSVDYLILDAQLPGMSGLELQWHLGANGFQAPVIFVTEDKDGYLAQALRGGALAFLRKPFEDEDLLLRAVRALGATARPAENRRRRRSMACALLDPATGLSARPGRPAHPRAARAAGDFPGPSMLRLSPHERRASASSIGKGSRMPALPTGRHCCWGAGTNGDG